MELVQMGARWYDPQIGRWLSPDTIIPDPANPQNFNRYSFVLNNPTRFTDPTGHCVEPLSGIVCVSAGALIVDVVTVAVAAYIIADTAQDIRQNLESIPAQGPEIPPLPGYGEGELERPPDPGVYNPGPTLEEVQIPLVLPGPSSNVQPSSTVLDFPMPNIQLPTVMEVRSGNKLTPVLDAVGPHSVFRRDPVTGQVSSYQTFVPQTNPQNSNPWESSNRFDGSGSSHYNKATQQDVDTPHIHDPQAPGGVRKPYKDELPGGY